MAAARAAVARAAAVPAYVVFTDASLVALAEARPRSAADLIKVQGLGPVKVDRYGEQLLAIMAGEVAPGDAVLLEPVSALLPRQQVPAARTGVTAGA